MSQTGEAQVPLLQTQEADAEWSSKPRRIALFVEPSPFALVSAFSSQPFSAASQIRVRSDRRVGHWTTKIMIGQTCRFFDLSTDYH